ncbi:MAG: SDR family NAD(P)-dependent oxidoreductase [Propionicimonas sp.]|nr:SDR family NAD(P)-dependent oxidoreductase [Propionicimonas sp.]
MATALVTGGTSGIGAAFARALAARGDDLVLVARNLERLEETAAELRQRHGIAVDVISADLALHDDVMRVGERLEDPERPIDLLVNNAGFGLHTKLLDPAVGVHEHALDVMCKAVLMLGGAAGRAMKARGSGQIINVSSASGWIAQGHYSAIKAWVRVYSESLANELHGTGATVTALCPGWVRTEFHDRAGIRTSGLPSWVWVDADRLVEVALQDAARGRALSIPTKRWKFAVFLAAKGPHFAIRAVSRMLTRSRD